MGSYRDRLSSVERRAPARDQGNNKPSTNRSPRRTDSDSRTKRVRIFYARPARRSSEMSRRPRPVPFPPAPRRAKSRQIRALPNRQSSSPRFGQGCRRGRSGSSLVAETLTPLRHVAPIRDPGEGTGDKRSRNRRRGAAPELAAEKAIPIRLTAALRSSHGDQSVNSASQIRSCQARRRIEDAGAGRASIHHRSLEDTDHRGARRLPAEVADAMRHVAAVAQCLAGRGRRCRVADVDLERAG